MNKLKRYLKPSQAETMLRSAMDALPPNVILALFDEKKRLFAIAGRGVAGFEASEDDYSIPLTIEGLTVGTLSLRTPMDTSRESARSIARLTADFIQGIVKSEYERRAVAAETLESYKDMALVQRASKNLNKSLKRADVAYALLNIFEKFYGATSIGSVYILDEEKGALRFLMGFGENAEEIFGKMAETALFRAAERGEVEGIIEDAASHPLWNSSAPPFGSLILVPMRSPQNEIIGLLLLARSDGEVFRSKDIKRASTLAEMAATSLRNATMFEAEKTMFRAFINAITTAIDAKSHFTAGHCSRVPVITRLLAEAACEANDGPLAGFSLNEDTWDELDLAALLHDCGKITTPEWVVDKATKLEKFIDRLELIKLRFEILRRDIMLESGGGERENGSLEAIMDDLKFLETCNQGWAKMDSQVEERVLKIADRRWVDIHGKERKLIEEDEIRNILIPRGTLTKEERDIIEKHVVHTINMLDRIPFPKRIKDVARYAGNHHERMDGSGYPLGLHNSELSIQSRIIAIADIFEALTAPDRPYRKPGSVDWALDVLREMKEHKHIDSDLFDIFVKREIHLKYAKEYLLPEQIKDKPKD